MRKRNTPPPPRPEPHPDLLPLIARVREAELAWHTAEDALRAVSVRLVVEKLRELEVQPLPKVEPGDPDGDLELGTHDCPRSPTARCVYFLPDDPNSDFCLFCSQPDDRG